MTLSSYINTTALQNSTSLLCTDCTKGEFFLSFRLTSVCSSRRVVLTSLLCSSSSPGLYTQLIALGNSTTFQTATNTSIVNSVTEFVTGICGAEFISEFDRSSLVSLSPSLLTLLPRLPDATAPTTITNGSNPDAAPITEAATTGAATGVFSVNALTGVLAVAGAVGAFLV